MIFDRKYSSCSQKQAVVVSQENGNEHRLCNDSRVAVYQYHVDGGIIKGNDEKRCDYVVEALTVPKPSAFFIELKGSDLMDALEQIDVTISRCRDELKGYDILPRVVLHKVSTHQIRGSEYRGYKRRYPRLAVGTRRYTDFV